MVIQHRATGAFIMPTAGKAGLCTRKKEGNQMETVNQDTTATTNTSTNTAFVNTPEKTFTQADVDKIVSDRLQRERQKYPDYEDLKAKAAKLDELEEANKTALQKATDRADSLQKELDGMKAAEAVRQVREKVAKEMNIPANLLTADTEDGCKEQAEAIQAYAKPGGYPQVKDGGEPQNTNGQATRDQFASWLNSQT